jgi:hypothetical protein
VADVIVGSTERERKEYGDICRLSVVGCWLLVVGCWLLVVGKQRNTQAYRKPVIEADGFERYIRALSVLW